MVEILEYAGESARIAQKSSQVPQAILRRRLARKWQNDGGESAMPVIPVSYAR